MVLELSILPSFGLPLQVVGEEAREVVYGRRLGVVWRCGEFLYPLDRVRHFSISLARAVSQCVVFGPVGDGSVVDLETRARKDALQRQYT